MENLRQIFPQSGLEKCGKWHTSWQSLRLRSARCARCRSRLPPGGCFNMRRSWYSQDSMRFPVWVLWGCLIQRPPRNPPPPSQVLPGEKSQIRIRSRTCNCMLATLSRVCISLIMYQMEKKKRGTCMYRVPLLLPYWKQPTRHALKTGLTFLHEPVATRFLVSYGGWPRVMANDRF